MKNIIRIGVLLLVLMSMSSAALAAGQVIFSGPGVDEPFAFKPGSEYTSSDMFDGFKGVMPGDKLTQEITVENQCSSKVRIYMKAEGAYNDEIRPEDEVIPPFNPELLKYMDMTVEVEGIDEPIFDDTADQQGDLAEYRSLAVLKKKSTVTMTVTLEVSRDLPNEFANQVGVVPWTFMAVEIPDESPETGDWFQIGIWAAAAVALAAGIVVILILKRRQREEN